MTIRSWLVSRERWLPALAGVAWWITFYPGFFGDDSLISLTEAQSGAISVWFTAWWVYLVDALSLGTRAIPLLTLAGVLTLEYAAFLWVAAVFPKGPARAVTVLVMSCTPLIGAMGIQVTHDVAATAGLLLCAAVATLAWTSGDRLTPLDYATLVLAMPLIATRHNGMPTVAATAAVLLLVSGARRWRPSAALIAVAAGTAVISYGATRAAGHAESVHPAQTVEWLIGDISCLLAKEGVEATVEEWSTLARIAGRSDWPQERACRVMNPILLAPSFDATAVGANYRDLIGVWLSLGARYPARMAGAHASRVRLFLPPFVTGISDGLRVGFLHSTILPNDFGLRWQFPALATRARNAVRAWNALGFILANAAVWLIVLVITAWRLPDYRNRLTPTIVMAVMLILGLLVAAPISEGRYGLFILICGQATAVFHLVTWRSRDLANSNHQITRSPHHQITKSSVNDHS